MSRVRRGFRRAAARLRARFDPYTAVSLALAVGLLNLGTALPAQQVRSVTLEQVLSDVLANHPAVKAADARVRAAQGARSTAGRLENPMLAHQVENAPLPGRAGPAMDREAMTMATFSLQSIYQRWPRVRFARAQLEASSAEAAMARQQIGLAAARAFYRYALAQVTVAATRDLVAWLDSIVAYNRVRVSEGAAAEADLIRSELERDLASAEGAMQAAELLSAQAEFRTFVSAADSIEPALDSVPLPVPPSAGDSIAVGRRPDVLSAYRRRAAADAAVGVERSMLIGEIEATVGVKQSAGTSSLIAGANLPFPLFNQNRGEVARASAERDAAAYEYALAERTALSNLRAARAVAVVLTERATALASGFLARADESRRVALGAYQEGAVPLIQVIDASRAWGDARRVFFQTLFAQHESVLTLLVEQGMPLSEFLQPARR